MPRKIAAAAAAMLLGLTALPSRADDINFLEIVLLKDRVNSTDEYGVLFDAGKDSATTCELETPSGTLPCVNEGILIPFGMSFTAG